MKKIKLHIITLFVLGLAFSAKANFDMTQEELVKKLGSVAETRASWAGISLRTCTSSFVCQAK